jgi:hypothetical protein
MQQFLFKQWHERASEEQLREIQGVVFDHLMATRAPRVSVHECSPTPHCELEHCALWRGSCCTH